MASMQVSGNAALQTNSERHLTASWKESMAAEKCCWKVFTGRRRGERERERGRVEAGERREEGEERGGGREKGEREEGREKREREREQEGGEKGRGGERARGGGEKGRGDDEGKSIFSINRLVFSLVSKGSKTEREERRERVRVWSESDRQTDRQTALYSQTMCPVVWKASSTMVSSWSAAA